LLRLARCGLMGRGRPFSLVLKNHWSSLPVGRVSRRRRYAALETPHRMKAF
jgi:hypothetical protein